MTDLLQILDALFRLNGRAMGRAGVVAVGVRQASAERWWCADLATGSADVSAAMPNADAALLLSASAARAIVHQGRCSEAGVLAFRGDLQLVASFIDRVLVRRDAVSVRTAPMGVTP
jgi:hypothetical protein